MASSQPPTRRRFLTPIFVEVAHLTKLTAIRRKTAVADLVLLQVSRRQLLGEDGQQVGRIRGAQNTVGESILVRIPAWLPARHCFTHSVTLPNALGSALLMRSSISSTRRNVDPQGINRIP